jgi:uncharacterized DUF497 family protein
VRIDWDPRKDRANRTKHGLSFEEVQALFEGNANSLVIYDEEHSSEEDRFLAVGPIAKGIITVLYTEPTEDIIRIIGARMATRREQALFNKHIRGTKR